MPPRGRDRGRDRGRGPTPSDRRLQESIKKLFDLRKRNKEKFNDLSKKQYQSYKIIQYLALWEDCSTNW